MKLSKLIENLKKIQKEYGDLDCVYSADDEGNDYKLVEFTPTVGEYDREEREMYYSCEEEDIEVNVNAVCIN